MNHKQDKNANMEDKIIIEKALENLAKQTGVTAIWRQQGRDVDGEIQFTYNEELYRIPVEVKKEVRAHQLGKLFDLKKKLKRVMVVAEYIYPKLKEELRAEGVAYLETNGNIFIKEGNLFLWVDNFKTEPKETGITGRAFAKTGLKLLFHFLVDEDLLNLTYREIALRTGIGFGNINFIMTDLKEQGFLLNINKDTYKFTRKNQLLQKWIQAYNEKLKPALEIGAFRFVNKDKYFNWKDIDLKPGETFWGGEPAGGILTDYLQPEQYTLYTTETRGDIIKRYQLAPDKNGDIKVYLKFWKFSEELLKTVPTLLVYADLINSNDRRCIQTAERIYDEYLQTKFRAN
jgi:hypothetical protein